MSSGGRWHGRLAVECESKGDLVVAVYVYTALPVRRRCSRWKCRWPGAPSRRRTASYGTRTRSDLCACQSTKTPGVRTSTDPTDRRPRRRNDIRRFLPITAPQRHQRIYLTAPRLKAVIRFYLFVITSVDLDQFSGFFSPFN